MAGEPSSYSSSPLPFNAITNVIDIAASLAYVTDVVAEGQQRTTLSLHSALANFAPVRMALKVSRFCQEQVRSARGRKVAASQAQGCSRTTTDRAPDGGVTSLHPAMPAQPRYIEGTSKTCSSDSLSNVDRGTV